MLSGPGRRASSVIIPESQPRRECPGRIQFPGGSDATFFGCAERPTSGSEPTPDPGAGQYAAKAQHRERQAGGLRNGELAPEFATGKGHGVDMAIGELSGSQASQAGSALQVLTNEPDHREMALLVVVELTARYAEMDIPARIIAVWYIHPIPNTWDDSRITRLDAGNLGTIGLSAELKLWHRALPLESAPIQHSCHGRRVKSAKLENRHEPETISEHRSEATDVLRLRVTNGDSPARGPEPRPPRRERGGPPGVGISDVPWAGAQSESRNGGWSVSPMCLSKEHPLLVPSELVAVVVDRQE